MNNPFRLSKNDTIKGHLLTKEGKLLASLYDSGYTTKEAVFQALIRKVPYTSAKAVECTISTEDGKYTRFSRKVNR